MLTISRSLTGTVQYVYSSDPAIDKDSPEFSWEKYRETGDVKHLPTKGESERLTVFSLKPISMKRMQRITSMRNESGGFSTEQFGEAVAYGLKKVDNFEVDGKPFSLEFEGASDEQRVKNKSLEKIFKQILFIELGNRVMEISDLSF